jgi:hypothetical protein
VYSALVVIAVWVAMIGIASRSNRLRSADYVPISFVSALSSVSLIAALLIQINAIHYVQRYGWLVALSILAPVVVNSGSRKRVVTALAEFFGFRDEGHAGEHKFGQGSALSSLARLIRRAMVCLVTIAMVATSMYQSNPGNWDSNIYNISRLPAMMLAKSIILTETGSVRQAIFPLGHDLLYYYDIALGNLRGLSAINLLEWLVILGILFGLVRLLVQARLDGGDDVLEVSLLFVMSLFIASDLQLFQGLSTKNDLVILLLFLATLQLVLRRITGCLSLRRTELIAVIFLMLTYAVHSKSYGVIILVPVAVAACFGLFSSTTTTTTNATTQVRWIDSSPQWPRSEALMLAGVILLSAANFAFYLYHSRTVISFYEPAAVKAVTTIWVNTSGPISTRLTNMSFNFVRFLLIILLYPFSTYLKQQPRQPDDYLFGLGSFGSVLGGGQGVAIGRSFTLMRGIREDSAIYSEVIHIAILIVVLAGLIALLRVLFDPSRSLRSWIAVQINQPVRTSMLMSSVMSLLVLSSILLYQSWIARFLGSVYVTLYPILAVELASIVIKFRIEQHRNALAFFLTTFTIAILPLAAALRFFSIANKIGLSEAWHTQKWHQFQDRTYYEYTNSNGIAYEQTRSLLQQLQSKRYSDLIVCYGEDAPTLVPLSKLVINPNADHARVRFGNEQTCHQPIVKDSGSGSVPGHHDQQPRSKDQAVDYVYLP